MENISREKGKGGYSMGAEFNNLTEEDMCNMMCGGPEDKEDAIIDEINRLVLTVSEMADLINQIATRLIEVEKEVAELRGGDDRK